MRSVLCLMFMKSIKCLFGIMTTSTYKRYLVVGIIINASYLLLFTKKMNLYQRGIYKTREFRKRIF